MIFHYFNHLHVLFGIAGTKIKATWITSLNGQPDDLNPLVLQPVFGQLVVDQLGQLGQLLRTQQALILPFRQRL